MGLIPREALQRIEHMIYLPMVLVILERDREIVLNGGFKLKRPYIQLLEKAIKSAQAELKETTSYLRRKNIKVTRGKTDDTFTEYLFSYGGYQEQRRYLNVRLRNQTEQLLSMYLSENRQVKSG